jgi:hypothetical protein
MLADSLLLYDTSTVTLRCIVIWYSISFDHIRYIASTVP